MKYNIYHLLLFLLKSLYSYLTGNHLKFSRIFADCHLVFPTTNFARTTFTHAPSRQAARPGQSGSPASAPGAAPDAPLRAAQEECRRRAQREAELQEETAALMHTLEMVTKEVRARDPKGSAIALGSPVPAPDDPSTPGAGYCAPSCTVVLESGLSTGLPARVLIIPSSWGGSAPPSCGGRGSCTQRQFFFAGKSRWARIRSTPPTTAVQQQQQGVGRELPSCTATCTPSNRPPFSVWFRPLAPSDSPSGAHTHLSQPLPSLSPSHTPRHSSSGKHTPRRWPRHRRTTAGRCSRRSTTSAQWPGSSNRAERPMTGRCGRHMHVVSALCGYVYIYQFRSFRPRPPTYTRTHRPPQIITL